MHCVARWAVLGIALVSLSGCFSRETAFITQQNADYPFTKMTFTAPEANGLNLHREGDVYKIAMPANVKAALIKRIGEDRWIYQLEVEGVASPMFVYLIAKSRPGGVQANYCNDYPEATLAKYGLSRLCRVDSMEQLVGLSQEETGKAYSSVIIE